MPDENELEAIWFAIDSEITHVDFVEKIETLIDPEYYRYVTRILEIDEYIKQMRYIRSGLKIGMINGFFCQKLLVTKEPIFETIPIYGGIDLSDGNFIAVDENDVILSKQRCQHLILTEEHVVSYSNLPVIQKIVANMLTLQTGSLDLFSPKILIDCIEKSNEIPEDKKHDFYLAMMNRLVDYFKNTVDCHRKLFYTYYIMYLLYVNTKEKREESFKAHVIFLDQSGIIEDLDKLVLKSITRDQNRIENGYDFGDDFNYMQYVKDHDVLRESELLNMLACIIFTCIKNNIALLTGKYVEAMELLYHKYARSFRDVIEMDRGLFIRIIDMKDPSLKLSESDIALLKRYSLDVYISPNLSRLNRAVIPDLTIEESELINADNDEIPEESDNRTYYSKFKRHGPKSRFKKLKNLKNNPVVITAMLIIIELSILLLVGFAINAGIKPTKGPVHNDFSIRVYKHVDNDWQETDIGLFAFELYYLDGSDAEVYEHGALRNLAEDPNSYFIPDPGDRTPFVAIWTFDTRDPEIKQYSWIYEDMHNIFFLNTYPSNISFHSNSSLPIQSGNTLEISMILTDGIVLPGFFENPLFNHDGYSLVFNFDCMAQQDFISTDITTISFWFPSYNSYAISINDLLFGIHAFEIYLNQSSSFSLESIELHFRNETIAVIN